MDDLNTRIERLSEAKRALLLKRLQGPESDTGETSIVADPRPGPAALSYTQQRVYFLQQLFPENTAYNMYEAWRVYGPLDRTVLQEALNEVIAQQPVLRTSFVTDAGETRQYIAQNVQIDIPVTDISHLPPEARESRLLELAVLEGNRPFDLGRAPLIRMTLIRLDHQVFALLLNLHHIITDEWSNDIFWRELNASYRRKLGFPDSRPAQPPVGYVDYARWQREQADSGAFDPQMRYWQNQLGGELPLLQLPYDHPRPADQSLRGGLVERSLPVDIWAAVQKLSRQTGATPYMVLLAAFKVLLSRYSYQEDILVGTPIANRQRPETKDVMGMFINTVVIRTDLSGDPSFLEVLDQVRQTVLDALANQDLPFDLLVRAMQPERHLSYNPIFQTMFVFQSVDGKRTLPDMRLERIPLDPGVSKFDLTLLAGEEDGRLVAFLEYNSDVFDHSTATRMLEHWQTLLQAITANPQEPLQTLPLISAPERELVLRAWNDTHVPLPSQVCVHELISARAARNPDAPAVITGDTQLSYARLEADANRLAHHLVGLGVTPGTPVGLFVERSAEMIIGIVGILKAGGAYVPLEPAYPSDRIAFALQDTDTPVVVTQAHLAERLPPTRARVITFEATVGNDDSATDAAPVTTVTLEDLAYVIYTSGSTGLPKGVMVTHGNLLASTLARKEIYDTPVGRYLLLSSFAFDSSVAGIFWTLADGGALVLPAPDEEKDVGKLATIIAQQRVTHTLALPALYRLLLAYAPDQALASLATVIVAGEACPPQLVAEHYALLPHCLLFNEYGPTEATVWSSVYRVPQDSNGSPVPIGQPVPNYRLYVLDNHRQPVPIGVPGELFVAGQGVTPGYWNNPDLTEERFPVLELDGYPEGVRVYRTGDLVRWRAGGLVDFLGRVDEQVKIRGFRIETGEIEMVLLRHPVVREAAVIVHEPLDDESPAGKTLLAYIGAEAGADEATLQQYLAETLPDYMIPSRIITLAELPRTPNGKLDRKKLPVAATLVQKRPFVPPRTATEKTLAGIWADILRVPEVSINDKFFELGGDSIMSIRVIARARQEGLVLTPRQLFKEQTIARLAAVAGTDTRPKVEQQPAYGRIPFTPIQHWFFEQELSHPEHWNQAAWFEGPVDLDVATLRAALDQIIAHHPMLQARYRKTGDGWEQEVVLDAVPARIELESLAGLEPAEQEARLLATANRLHADLNLADGRLVAGSVFTMGTEQPPRVLLIIHHLVVDAVSWGTITSDLAVAYRQISRGETVSLPATTTSFAQWSQTLATLAGSDDLQKETRYWLEPVSAPPNLPRTAAAVGGNTEGESKLITTVLDAQHTGSLLREVHAAYHTRMEDLLLAALARAIGRWTGGRSTLLTLEHHGREDVDSHVDVSRTVGWFTTLFPICLALADPSDAGADLRAVKEQLRRVPRNGIGYGILRYLGDQTDRQRLSDRPQPEILFNYLGQAGLSAGEDDLLRPLEADTGQAYGPQNKRAHLIDINAQVIDGRLTVNWQYAPAYFLASTIQKVADSYLIELVQLINHCLEVDLSRYTPSDFPLAGLQQDDLNTLSDLLSGLDEGI
jgi:amino acid adenylation domain-containing protein/non-ribosomal peptide synthase protein (TIGR01720 family)